jgi:hypothetical protein
MKLTDKQEKAFDLLVDPSKEHVLLAGGSRSGKTFLGCYWSLLRQLKYPGSRGLIYRDTLVELKRSVIMDTMPKMIKLTYPELLPSWEARNKQDNYWKLPHGSEIWFAGLGNNDNAEKILGTEFLNVYGNEISTIGYASRNKVLTRLAQKAAGAVPKEVCDCNPPTKIHWAHRLWFEGVDPMDPTRKMDVSDYAEILMNPEDNRDNLPDGYMKLLKNLPEHDKNRFLLGIWGDSVFGAVFAKEFDRFRDHAVELHYDKRYPLYTAWDIGYNDNTAIWVFQVRDGKICIIDFIEGAMEGAGYYINELDIRKYPAGVDFLPHDGANHEWAMGRSRRAILHEDYKRNVEILPRVDEGTQIEAVRRHFPRIYWAQNNPAVVYGIEKVKSVHRDYNDKLGVLNPALVHDANLDAGKAFIYLAMAIDGREQELNLSRAEREQIEAKEYKELIDKINNTRGIRV